jgi:hypothetical protein
VDNEQCRPDWPALLSLGESVPQKTLFDGWNIDQITFDIKLNINKPGGSVYVHFTDELGKSAGSRKVQWSKDRDCSDLGLVARDVINAFMFAPQLEMIDTLQRSFKRHCPEVPMAS